MLSSLGSILNTVFLSIRNGSKNTGLQTLIIFQDSYEFNQEHISRPKVQCWVEEVLNDRMPCIFGHLHSICEEVTRVLLTCNRRLVSVFPQSIHRWNGMLLKWVRKRLYCTWIMEKVEDSKAATASFTQSFTFEPASVITSDINDQPDATSDDDQPPDCPLLIIYNPKISVSNHERSKFLPSGCHYITVTSWEWATEVNDRWALIENL